MGAEKAQIHIQVYTWGDPRVLQWEKKALTERTAVQEIEPNLLIIWLSSRDKLEREEYNKTEIARAAVQWTQELEQFRDSSVDIQCKTEETEDILARVKDLGTLTIYNNDYKPLVKKTGRTSR